jgi:hypothetical protein
VNHIFGTLFKIINSSVLFNKENLRITSVILLSAI